MPMIFTREKPLKKQNRKPGWQQKEAEYQAWLKQVNSVSLFGNKTSPFKQSAIKNPVKPVSVIVPQGPVNRTGLKPASLMTFGGVGGKSVARPELQYRDNPEMLERELVARQRKFNVAPAYNKGGDVLITEAELVNTLSSNKRRS